MIKCYRDLDVWKRSIELVKSIYKVTERFPKSEQFGLTSQIRRAAVSIASNIAEGHTRQHSKEFIHFISISLGSIAELETQLTISRELGYIGEEYEKQILLDTGEIGKMLNGLSRKLK